METHESFLQTEQGTKTKATKTSPKKRAAANTPAEVSPKKKRASSKVEGKAETTSATPATPKTKKGRTSKAAKAPSVEPKVESDVENGNESSGEGVAEHNDPVPVTPGKGARTPKAKAPAEPKTPKAPKTPKNSHGAKDKQGSPTPKSTERKRSVAAKVADKVSLPTTWANASEADKKLVKMKEDKASWNEIRAMWLEKTGQDTAGSTLPNR